MMKSLLKASNYNHKLISSGKKFTYEGAFYGKSTAE